MRCVGHALFDGGDLVGTLVRSEGRIIRDAVFDLLLTSPAPTRLDLQRGALQALQMDPICLASPSPAVMTRARGGSAPYVLNCVIPFTGTSALFRMSAPMWPPGRRVLGETGENTLVLTADGWSGDEAWLAAVIGSELAEIERVLAAQAVALRVHMRPMEERVRALIDRIHTRINQRDLLVLMATTSLASKPRFEKLAREASADLRARMWRAWSK